MSQWLNFEFYASQYVIATESILKAAQGTPFQKKTCNPIDKKNSSMFRTWVWRHVVIWWTPNRKTLRSRFWLSQRLNFELQNRFHNRARSGLEFEGHTHCETRSVHPSQRWRALCLTTLHATTKFIRGPYTGLRRPLGAAAYGCMSQGPGFV